nr:hypothetical protein [Haemophilus parahaemolyticus]
MRTPFAVGQYVQHAQGAFEKAGKLVVDFDLHPAGGDAVNFDVVHDVCLQ